MKRQTMVGRLEGKICFCYEKGALQQALPVSYLLKRFSKGNVTLKLEIDMKSYLLFL